VTSREKRAAYRGTVSYRRLNHRLTFIAAVWAVAGFLIVSFPERTRLFSIGVNAAFWLAAGVVMWLGIRLLVVFMAGFIPEARLQAHLREGSQHGAA
jgi:hypothetical protein